MKLDDAQKLKVSEWIAGGGKLAEIQNRLFTELGLKLTYIEVRFLVDDLKLTPKDPEPPKPAALPTPAPPPGPVGSPAAARADTGTALTKGAPVPAAEAGPGGVSVTLDQLTRPGAMVSGMVTFSDGGQAEWYLDQAGRLGVVPKVQGYKPTPADVEDFQVALQNELAKLGY